MINFLSALIKIRIRLNLLCSKNGLFEQSILQLTILYSQPEALQYFLFDQSWPFAVSCESNAISFHFFLRLRLCFDILPRIALRGIGAERCVKWKSMGLELTLIDGLEKMLFYLHSLLCCSWMKAQQSSNGLLRLSFSPIPTTTYESHLKTAQKFRRRATINQKVSQIATLKLGGAEVKAVSLLPNC